MQVPEALRETELSADWLTQRLAQKASRQAAGGCDDREWIVEAACR
jgi:hypothetical protein